MTLCPACGADIAPDENFCGKCGMPQQRDHAPPDAVQASAGNDV
ncbi:MAG: zinc ribbon domain-containing protein [Acidobacteriota bacterium]